MKPLKALQAIFRSIHQHPLAGKHRWMAYAKFVSWQLDNLVKGGEKKVAFTDATFLIAKKGMTGATGNIYMGLHEFQEMGFLLHFLRKGDVFFDIGANIGSYTVLASGHVGCTSLAFEPIPSTFLSLEKNIKVNNIADKVKAFNVGIGAKKGSLYFTANNDTVNHVVAEEEKIQQDQVLEIPILSIDETIGEQQLPALIKIDVEGFETEVLNGMEVTLQNESLKAIIIELNGSGGRYGFDENDIHTKLIQADFIPYTYDPFTRKLTQQNHYGKFNTIYLRDITFVQNRVISAAPISVFSETF